MHSSIYFVLTDTLIIENGDLESDSHIISG